MDGTTFIGEIKNGPYKDPRDNVFSTLWAEYEEVVMYSLVTSFGLDFLVHDQHGGDVDTIHNVKTRYWSWERGLLQMYSGSGLALLRIR